MLVQSNKSRTTLLQKKFGEQAGGQLELLDAMVGALEKAGVDTKRFGREVEKRRNEVSQLVTVGLSDVEGNVAEAAALRAALKDAEELNATLSRRVKALEARAGGGTGSATATLADEAVSTPARIAPPPLPAATPAAGAGGVSSAAAAELERQVADLKRQVRTLETQLSSANARAAAAASAAPAATSAAAPPSAAGAAPAVATSLPADVAEIASLKSALTAANAEIDQLKARAGEISSKVESGQAEAQTLAATYKEREEKLKAQAMDFKKRAEAQIEHIQSESAKRVATLEQQLASAGKNRDALKRCARTVLANLASLRQTKTDTVRLVRTQFTEIIPLFGDIERQVGRRIVAFAGSYGSIVENYKKEQRERKRLYNELQELKGNIRVFCRVRPLLGDEVGRDTVCVSFGAENTEIAVVNSKKQRKVCVCVCVCVLVCARSRDVGD
jgi:kinesin family protein C2/C3